MSNVADFTAHCLWCHAICSINWLWQKPLRGKLSDILLFMHMHTSLTLQTHPVNWDKWVHWVPTISGPGIPGWTLVIMPYIPSLSVQRAGFRQHWSTGFTGLIAIFRRTWVGQLPQVTGDWYGDLCGLMPCVAPVKEIADWTWSFCHALTDYRGKGRCFSAAPAH